MPRDKVGWNRVAPPNRDAISKLQTMMKLHGFYFEKTERQEYLAKVQGSNLIREIRATINSATGGCQRAPLGYSFIGLVGHDTNIASIGRLLNVSWQFKDVPDPDTHGLPDNDALPAGALVFELWKRDSGSFVRVYYVTQGLLQMRGYPRVLVRPFRIPAQGPECQGQPSLCEIPLTKFNELVNKAIGTEFLSKCKDGQQTCP